MPNGGSIDPKERVALAVRDLLLTARGRGVSNAAVLEGVMIAAASYARVCTLDKKKTAQLIRMAFDRCVETQKVNDAERSRIVTPEDSDVRVPRLYS